MAKIKISPQSRLDLIAAAAGQTDIEKCLYRDGFLEIKDVSQEALELAVDHPSVRNPIVAETPKTIEQRISELEQEIIKLKGE